ncbi:uncharacterized protein DMAD_01362 [Drosophila madeirensis]|uniref:Uncharacterized protein n=1 Tax=Drosophila madeirensis TaxID=30013 RepID=A0AAU9G0M1_DROMD
MNSNERDALSPEVGGLGSSRLEFRFAGPDSMQNAVQRHNDQRAAELAEQSRRRDDSGKSMGGGPIFCKVRISGRDVISKYTSRDMDVETQLSVSSATDKEKEPAVAAPKCRHFQQSIPSSLDSLEPLESVPAWVQASGAMLMGVQPPLQQQQAQRVRVSEGKSKLQIPPCVQRWALKVPPKPSKRAAKTQPKRRVIPEELRQANSDAGDAGDAGDGSEKKANIQKAIEVLYREPTACFADVIPSPMMSQAIRVKVCEAPNISYFAAGQFMLQHRSLEPESTAPFFREDSDLEHEYKHREEYLCEVGSRPSCGSSQADATLATCHKRPMFCEVECGSRGVHLWRSLNPLRYTSQRSEETPASSSQHQVVPLPHKKSPAEKEKDELQTLHSRQPGGRDGKSSQAATATATATVPCQQPKRRRCRQMQLPVCSQSLEHLKCQKLGIYKKISLKQDRIIGALDRLQHSLLQLQVPECSSQERRKRERNAFEFCVRFSRNFLYPLKGMIDDVRRTPVTYFHSATSNEACQRVVSVYGLMHQSIATYQRQLRYFLLDKVPQKLSALMEMIYTLSNTCVEKGILDRQDPVVECLRERCTKFLSFIEDMQEERFKLAREQYRRVHRQPHPTQSVGKERKSKQKYDLKMCLNDHKMYEPRLVAKKKPQELKLKRGRVARTKAATSVARATESAADTAQSPEEVQTQVAMDDMAKAKLTEQQPAAGRDSRNAKLEDELQQALIDALRHVSTSEVHQVLDPLMRSIGAILDEKMPKH